MTSQRNFAVIFCVMGGFSMRYTRYSTANDVMKEFLIYGAELTEMGFPKLPAVQAHPSDTYVDLVSLFFFISVPHINF